MKYGVKVETFASYDRLLTALEASASNERMDILDTVSILIDQSTDSFTFDLHPLLAILVLGEFPFSFMILSLSLLLLQSA